MPPPADRSAERSSLVPYEWWPGMSGLSAIVHRSRARCDAQGHFLLKGDTPLVRGVSKYGDWELLEPFLTRIHGDWTFSHITNLEYGNETMDVHWAPPMPGSDPTQPGTFVETLADEQPGSETYDWPNVLMDSRIILEQSKGSHTGLLIDLSAAVERGLWRDGISLECRVETRLFVSALRPPLNKVKCDPPIPTSIKGDYFGTPVRLPACLHPYVEMTSINSSDATIFDLTPTKAGIRGGNLMVWRPTNHQTWQKHVFSNKVSLQGGLWVRTEKTVIPPAMPGITYT